MNSDAALALTRDLIRIKTVNPPGNESDAVRLLKPLLQNAGFSIQEYGYGPNRSSLVAHIGPIGKPSVILSGHLDTVPLGSQPWTVNPFAATVTDGKLYGRGAADMKSGVAVLVTAAIELASRIRTTPMTLVLSADEEVGCAGAEALVNQNVLPEALCILVAEPTGNIPCLGHKGVLWVKTLFHGRTAHAAFPEYGDNALLKAAKAVLSVEQGLDRGEPHPVMGELTMVPSRFFSGDNYNSVPDLAEVGFDIRSTVNQPHKKILADLQHILNSYEGELEVIYDLPPLWTSPENKVVQKVVRCCNRINVQQHAPTIASFYTDGGILGPGLGNAPVIILGPGSDMAHKVDEYVPLSDLHRALEIYLEILASLCC